MRAILSTLRHDHSAATAIEYALVAFLVSIAGFVTYTNIGSQVTKLAIDGSFGAAGDSSSYDWTGTIYVDDIAFQ